ncbi:MAG: hypothetical protein WBG14_17390, partial [Rhodococcus sp. (in: high G+C Gram-positive bacteria)]
MTDSTDTHSTDRRGSTSRKRPILLIVGVVLVIVVAFVAWLAYEAVSAKSSLETTRDAANRAKDALLDGDVAGAQAAAAD